MKLTPYVRGLLPVLFLAGSAWSRSRPNRPAPTNAPDGPHLPPPILDNDEMMQLVKARQQVLAANPDLQAEEEKLKALHESSTQTPAPTAEQRNAMFAEWKAYQKTMRAAMLKIDPTLTPDLRQAR